MNLVIYKSGKKDSFLFFNYFRYAYVHNDPVGHVDLWGLTASDKSNFQIGQNVNQSNTFIDQMSEPMKTSEQGIEFIKMYESFRSTPYKATANGNLTIGYGHEIKDGESFTEITEEEASVLLREDLKWIEDGINKNYEGSVPLTQQQFDAMVSLGINAGRSGLIRSQVFANAENNVTDEQKILDGFRTKNTSNGEYLEGLDHRRYDEAEMYLYGDYSRDDDLFLNKPGQ